MKVTCPNCGTKVAVGGLGRKPLDMPVKNILDKLRKYRSVAVVAQELGCSRGYIYSVLKANGLKLQDVVDGKDIAKAKEESCRGLKPRDEPPPVDPLIEATRR